MTAQQVNLLLTRLHLYQVLHQDNDNDNDKAVADLQKYYGHRFRNNQTLYDWHTKKHYSKQDIETLIRNRGQNQ